MGKKTSSPGVDIVPVRHVGRGLTPASLTARARISRDLSRRLPYYLTIEEVHQLIDATDNERDRLFLRVLWETGV
jgi:integrase